MDKKLKRKLNDIENIIHYDIGNRGINKIFCQGDITEACINLIKLDNIIIATGFYIFSEDATETDGPPGALALANALISLGKKICLLTDKHNYRMLSELQKINHNEFNVICYRNEINLLQLLEMCGFENSSKTGIISVECPGRNIDGKFYNMNGVDITDYMEPVDNIFVELMNNSYYKLVSFGIGDGGNEIGMGNVKEKVSKFIPFGNEICSVVTVNHLITTGVSNWAGIAIAAAMKIITKIEKVEVMDVFLHSKIIKNMIELGSVDGVTKKQEESVDGFPLSKHNEIINKILRVVNE